MTEEGTFILNGCERVIISQIIRSPGVYFRKEFGTVRKTIYTATIISNKGLWTKIILDQNDAKKEKTGGNTSKKDRIYLVNSEFKLKTTDTKKDSDSSKIYIYDLIKYFGLNFQELSDSSRYPLDLSNCQYTN